MKKRDIIILLGILFLFPGLAQPQPERIFEQFLDRMGPRVLQVIQLEMTPDPVREGQWISFQATISNLSRFPGRVSLSVKDKDEVISEVHDIILEPGDNRVVFPQTRYRFSRHDHCFTVEVNVGRTRRQLDMSKEFCAKRAHYGWTLAEVRVGPLFIEELEMIPDPVRIGQEIRFKVRLRNDGFPLRADIRIQDRDQTVVQLNDAFLPRGHSEFQFPPTRYQFQHFDHCFKVFIDVERTPYLVDAFREFCAKPLGWSLRP
jgi:hypothetical protein